MAHVDEADTSAVVVMPPLPSDTTALSQRLLIQLAEALQARRARLARPTVVSESEAIGRDQARLRREVADVIFLRLSGEAGGEHAHASDVGGEPLTPEELLAAAEAATAVDPGHQLDFAEDESPVVAVNRPLLEAYNAMWDATRQLDIGEPGRALPHMRLALEAIQRARSAERVYLRGRTPRVVVNLEQVRLSGQRDRIVTGPRRPLQPDSRAGRLARLLLGAELARVDAVAARDSLLVLRVEILADDAPAAALLGEAIAALRDGRDPSNALAVARGALAQTGGASTLGAW